MSVNPEKVMAATKAAYPELWPTDEDALANLPGQQQANLAFQRQSALDRIGLALQAYEEPVTADDNRTVAFVLPEEVAIVQQAIAMMTCIEKDGSMSYVVRMIGEGGLPSWLGMTTMAQHYLLNQAESGWEEA